MYWLQGYLVICSNIIGIRADLIKIRVINKSNDFHMGICVIKKIFLILQRNYNKLSINEKQNYYLVIFLKLQARKHF